MKIFYLYLPYAFMLAKKMTTDVSGGTIETRAIQFYEKLRGVTEPEVMEQNTIAGGILVAVRHKKDGLYNYGWYFEKGDIRKALYKGTEVALFIESQMAPRPFIDVIKITPFPELIKVVVVSLLTVFFAIAVVYLVITQPDNKSLQVLTGLLGLTIGYFVGKADMPK